MMPLRSLIGTINKITKHGYEPALIIINEKDMILLEKQTNYSRKVGSKTKDFFGLRVIEIPTKLYSQNFLKEDFCLVFDKRYLKLIMEALK